MNHLLFYLLIREISAGLDRREIRSIRLLQPLLSFELTGRSEVRFLVVVLSTPGPFFYMTDVDPVGEAGAKILKRIHGLTIVGRPDPPRDRILNLGIEPTGDPTSLAVSLFGSAAKVRVVSGDRIVESIDSAETGSAVSPPRQPGIALAEIDRVTLAEAISQSGEPKRRVLGLASELITSFRTPGGAIDVEGMLSFRDALLTANEPFCLVSSGRLGRVTPVPIDPPRDAQHILGPFKTAVEACAVAGELMAQAAYEVILDRLRGPLRRYVDTRRELRARLERELSKARRFDAGRHEADILAAYQTSVPTGASKVELPDLYNPERKRIITLDPSLPIAQQIRKRYKLAAKLERSQQVLEKRISEIDRIIVEIDDTLARAGGGAFADAFRGLTSAVVSHRLLRQDRRVPQRGTRVKQYRRYDLGGGWFVLVGRNDAENDEITFQVSSPDDLWMHAQQVPGSHVVLRSSAASDTPPKTILEDAAAIAAYYSKARRSRVVPVIYTRRKYVRKFRGANRGQVRCEREKTIFVEPRLPDES